MPVQLQFDRKSLTDFCRKNRIKSLAVFGSSVRGDMGPESDVDVLAEFTEPVGLFEICRIEEKMSTLLFDGRKVDLVIKKSLSRHIRDEVLESCEVIHEE